jgi:hypothetical protein
MEQKGEAVIGVDIAKPCSDKSVLVVEGGSARGRQLLMRQILEGRDDVVVIDDNNDVVDEINKQRFVESYPQFPYHALPELPVFGAEKKKKKPCTYHEYTEENGIWKCRHCNHPLK